MRSAFWSVIGVSFTSSDPTVRLAARGSRRGSHPEVFPGQRRGELAAAGDPELGVDVGEVSLDGLQRHVEPVRDLPVGLAVRGQPGDPQLAGRERVQPVAPFPPGRPPAAVSSVVRPAGQRPGPAAGGQVERLGQQRPGGGPLPGPAQRRAEFGQGLRPLEQGRGLAQDVDRLGQPSRPSAPPVARPATRSAIPSARRPPKPRASASSASASARARSRSPSSSRAWAAPDRACR